MQNKLMNNFMFLMAYLYHLLIAIDFILKWLLLIFLLLLGISSRKYV